MATSASSGGLKPRNLRPPAMGALDHRCGERPPSLRMAWSAVTSARKVIDRFEPLDQAPFQGAASRRSGTGGGRGSKGRMRSAAILAGARWPGTWPRAA